jgi:enoyl-CoA hydratase/carnithine racemase
MTMVELQDRAPALDRDGAIAWITLQRPGKLNRLSPQDLQAMQAHCNALAQDTSVRVVVLTSDTTGQKRPVFCAGYDVGGFEGQDHDPNLFENTVQCLAQLPQVVLAVVNGSVYGGATDLVLACDLRMGLSGAEFRMPACALGLHYYPSGLQRYVQVLGLDGARQAFLTASALPLERLHAWGAMVSLHDAQDLSAAAQALAMQVAALAPLAVQGTKASLLDIAQGGASNTMLREREARCLASADFAEGRRAFAERRQPQFTGH